MIIHPKYYFATRQSKERSIVPTAMREWKKYSVFWATLKLGDDERDKQNDLIRHPLKMSACGHHSYKKAVLCERVKWVS